MIVPLILIGGLGFGVLYNISTCVVASVLKMIRQQSCPERCFQMGQPVRLQLQSKIVLVSSALLVLVGTGMILFFEHFSIEQHTDDGFLSALFHSVSGRTAGFNTT